MNTTTNGKVDFAGMLHGNLHRPEQEYAELGDVRQAPPLPEYAQLSDEELYQANDTGQFLKDYVHFANIAAPMTPPEFHVAAALSAVSIAVARRLHVPASTQKIYPNLYTLFVGESTLHRKTTGLNVLTGLLNKAGMTPAFTLAERQTPEAFTEDLSLSFPPTYDKWTEKNKDTWLKRRPLAAQRGWLLDEASHLLDSFSRDYSSGLLPVVLDLYDSKDDPGGRNTKSNGLEVVEKAYLTIFGCTTYEAMAEHMGKAAHWRNGLYARFALVTSDVVTQWQFWPPPMEHPYELVNAIRFIAFGLFGSPPTAEIIEKQANENSPVYKHIEVSPLPDHVVVFGDGAWAAWERYGKAVGYDMLLQANEDNSIERFIYANYGRFSTMLIKVAMLFAVMDARQLPIIIERKHIFAAQLIVESWRSTLHKVRAGGNSTAQKTKTEEIKLILAQNGNEYTIRRDLLRALNCAWSDIEQAMQDLNAAGEIETAAYQPQRGPKSEKYRLLLPTSQPLKTVILS